MFETSEVKITRRGPLFWVSAVFFAIVVLFVINLVRVNRRTGLPPPSPNSLVQKHSEGSIAYERAALEPGGFLPFRVNFNYRSAIKGSFQVIGDQPRVLFLIMDERNFESWRQGNEFNSFVSTGKVPAGEVSRTLDAGTYFLVFDNRHSQQRVVIDIDLRAE